MFEIGKVYTYNSGNVSPCFISESGDRLYADDGFVMNYGGKDIYYEKGIIHPLYRSNCACTSISPLTFEVDEVSSPIVETDIAKQHVDIVRNVLKSLKLPSSELAVQAVVEVAIPWEYNNKLVTESVVKQALIDFVTDEVGSTYTGSTEGHAHYISTLKSVLTVVFNHRLAYAILKLNDMGDIRAVFSDNSFKVYYKGVDLDVFLTRIEGKLGVSTEKDPMQKFASAAGIMG